MLRRTFLIIFEVLSRSVFIFLSFSTFVLCWRGSLAENLASLATADSHRMISNIDLLLSVFRAQECCLSIILLFWRSVLVCCGYLRSPIANLSKSTLADSMDVCWRVDRSASWWVVSYCTLRSSGRVSSATEIRTVTPRLPSLCRGLRDGENSRNRSLAAENGCPGLAVRQSSKSWFLFKSEVRSGTGPLKQGKISEIKVNSFLKMVMG